MANAALKNGAAAPAAMPGMKPVIYLTRFAAPLNRLLKKSEKQIPRGLKFFGMRNKEDC
jgi:hypothetical protein